MTILDKYKAVIFDTVKSAGKAAPEGLGEARIAHCKTRRGGKPCEFVGEVTPVPGATTEGCTKCGCPFATKPYMVTLLGKKIECPHPDGNLWALIDEKFKPEL